MLRVEMLDHRVLDTQKCSKVILEFSCDFFALTENSKRRLICPLLAELSTQSPEVSLVLTHCGRFFASIDPSGDYNNSENPEVWDRYGMSDHVREIWP